MKITINSKELVTNLLALAFLCAGEGTDNCDIALATSNGEINCHIEFSKNENDSMAEK